MTATRLMDWSLCSLLAHAAVHSPCPSGGSVWRRISYLRNVLPNTQMQPRRRSARDSVRQNPSSQTKPCRLKSPLSASVGSLLKFLRFDMIAKTRHLLHYHLWGRVFILLHQPARNSDRLRG